MKRDEGEELRPPHWELEDSSLEGLSAALTEEPITRARAIKLAGAALLAGTGLTVLFQSPAEARKRRRRKRRRRKARVTPNPVPVDPTTGTTLLNITNPSDRPLTISGAQLLDSTGNLISAADLTDPVTIEPNTTVPVTFTFDPSAPLVNADSLRLLDAQTDPITVVANDGTVLGDVDVVVQATV